jgi:hypothetical protein
MTPPNPLAADLDLLTIPKAIVECSSSDPVSRFENQNTRIESLQVTGRHQAGEPRSDHNHIDIQRPHHLTSKPRGSLKCHIRPIADAA